MNYEHIRQKIQTELKERDLSISALERLSKLPINSIRMFLDARHKTIKEPRLKEIANVLNITMDELIQSKKEHHEHHKVEDTPIINPEDFRNFSNLLCSVLEKNKIDMNFSDYFSMIKYMNQYLHMFKKNMDETTILWQIKQYFS